jgi:glucose-1-phosphate cytidylyltransferase
MKVVIFAGGKGTRIAEESVYRPKPLIEIGGKPILWHIMDWYSSFGYNEFIICCGYKGQMIKQYFLDYYTKNSDIKVDLETGGMRILSQNIEPWKVTLVNTGLGTLTSGRLMRVRRYIDGDTFMMTYGDGVGNIDIPSLLKQYYSNGKFATISLTKPEGRFGAVQISRDTGLVECFREKARGDQSWVNIGFSVFSTEIFNYLGDGNSMLEDKPYELLAKDGQMGAYFHKGFWSPMDTVKDKEYLEGLWNTGSAPWKRPPASTKH